MDLQAYLDRIEFRGTPRADLDTLTRVHRGHLENIPYENLDVQLARPIAIDAHSIYRKLVTECRGGWCYEMNGLMAWALEEIGFKVTRMAGAVMRVVRGDDAVGNHLVLRVDLDRPYLADVGFGDGMVEPAPLAEHNFKQRLYDFRLEDIGQGWWRFHNHPNGGAPSFDFQEKLADPALLSRKCQWLQTSPESLFVLNAVVQRHLPDRLAMLRGKSLKTVSADGVAHREIVSASDYVRTLRETFALDLPDAAALWPKIEARHAELFGNRDAT